MCFYFVRIFIEFEVSFQSGLLSLATNFSNYFRSNHIIRIHVHIFLILFFILNLVCNLFDEIMISTHDLGIQFNLQ